MAALNKFCEYFETIDKSHPADNEVDLRILNTMPHRIGFSVFRSTAHQTWYMETMLQWTQNWSKIKAKLGQGKC